MHTYIYVFKKSDTIIASNFDNISKQITYIHTCMYTQLIQKTIKILSTKRAEKQEENFCKDSLKIPQNLTTLSVETDVHYTVLNTI